MASATIVGFDYVSGGIGWVGRYGRQGYKYQRNFNDGFVAVLPDWIDSVDLTTFDGSPAASFDDGKTWFNSAPMATVDGDTTTKTWYGGGVWTGGLNVNLVVNDNAPHLVSLYSFDGNSGGRFITISVLDYSTSTPLTGEITTPQYFVSGVWTRVAFQGSVQIHMAAWSDNVPVTGILFDDHSGICGLGDGVGSYIC